MDAASTDIDLHALTEAWERNVRRAVYAISNCDGDRHRLLDCRQRLETTHEQIKHMVQIGILDPTEEAPTLDHLSFLLNTLEEHLNVAVDTTVSVRFQPVSSVRSGKPGRPQAALDPSLLQQASCEQHLGTTQIANLFGVSRSTVRKAVVGQGLRRPFERTRSHSNLPDAQLDQLVTDLLAYGPMFGEKLVQAGLRAQGFHVTRTNVRASLNRVRPLRELVHSNRPLTRRHYEVAGPNSLWHHDGQHALITYGIVIHGFIDGYSRLLTGLRAASNNRASTVLTLFRDATEEYGIPSRVRGDRGGENVGVAAFMEEVRGTERGSYLWGTSPHNQRIERFWRDLKERFLNGWVSAFRMLQAEHGLNVELSRHVWLLSFLFLDDLNADLRMFREIWNCHGLRTEQNLSPIQMYWMGSVQRGGRGIFDNSLLIPNQVVDPLRDLMGGRFNQEIRGHVDLHNQRCPFADNPDGLSALQEWMSEHWLESHVDRWVEAVQAMERFIEI